MPAERIMRLNLSNARKALELSLTEAGVAG